MFVGFCNGVSVCLCIKYPRGTLIAQCMCICMYVYAYVCISLCIWCVYVYVCMCIYVCVYVFSCRWIYGVGVRHNLAKYKMSKV